MVIRALIQQRPSEHCGVIIRLVRRLDVLRAPSARAAVVWLAAWEHAGPNDQPPPEGSDAAKLLKMAPEALRQVTRTFCEEEEEVKLQLLGSCGKLYVRTPKAVGLLYKHILDLCDLDASYDIRDRARLMRALLPPPGADGAAPAIAPLQAHAAAVLFCAKPTPPLPSPAAAKGMHSLGTLSQTVQHTAPGYMPLPPHPEVPPPSHTRSAPIRPLGALGDAPVTGLRIATGAGAARPAGALAGATNDGFFSSSGGESGEPAFPPPSPRLHPPAPCHHLSWKRRTDSLSLFPRPPAYDRERQREQQLLLQQQLHQLFGQLGRGGRRRRRGRGKGEGGRRRRPRQERRRGGGGGEGGGCETGARGVAGRRGGGRRQG